MSGPSLRLGSGLMYRSDLCWCLLVAPWQRILTWILGLKVIQVAGSQMGMHLLVPNVLQSTSPSQSTPSIVQVGTLPKLLGQWRSITFNRFNI